MNHIAKISIAVNDSNITLQYSTIQMNESGRKNILRYLELRKKEICVILPRKYKYFSFTENFQSRC